MSTDGGKNGELRRQGEDIQGLEDKVYSINGRLSIVEGSYATKEDVLNAKVQLILAWSGAILSLVVAVAVIASRFVSI